MKRKIKSGFDVMVRLGAAKTTKWVAAAAFTCVAVALSLLHVLSPKISQTGTIQTSISLQSDDLIGPIEQIAGLDPRKVELGRELFRDPRLSHNNQIACSSCHDLAAGGADGRARSIGINGAVGQVNSPTVLNSGLNFSQFWDGRAETLEQQIDGPLENAAEMGSTWQEVIAKLQASPDYVHAYRQIYGSQIQREGVKDVIAVFEKSLATPNSRFDRYLRHEPGALTSSEQQGYTLFKTLGCVSCHQGASLGGNMYQKLGVMAPYFEDRGHVSKADLGRFNVTGDQEDVYMFKVPSLRNVALTAPYFHDGKAQTLPDAVRMMGKYQLGRNLSNEETELLVKFLGTLTGELNGKPL
jgi:cytochrome c peroxidase